MSSQNFGELLGKSAIKKAEKQIKSDVIKREDSNEVISELEEEQQEREAKQNREPDAEEVEETATEPKYNIDLDLDKTGFARAFGFELASEGRNIEGPETIPSRSAFGFDRRPMSFKTNFEQEVQFDGLKSRVKRSHLGGLDPRLGHHHGHDTPALEDLAISASAQRPHALNPHLISSMFARQLALHEDHHGLPVHDAVPVVTPPHKPQPVAVAHHPQPAHLTLGHSHHFVREHQVHPVQPVHHAVVKAPAPVHHVTHHTPFKGYPAPKHGGTLEDIFGLHNGKYVAPTPAPAYKIPVVTATYSPPAKPEPAYKAPVVVAPVHHPVHHPEPDYITPHKGHPFSMEMVFGLPMPMYYMKKYRHMLPHASPTPKYTPTPVYTPKKPVAAYKEPEPVYHDPATHYLPPQKGGLLEDVFGVASKYHSPKPAIVPLLGVTYKPEPVYKPEPAYKPAKPTPVYHPEVKAMPGYQNHYDHNSYSLHYMPYQDYEPVHPESKAVKARVPSIPGAAHFLTRAPHPHLSDVIHSRHPSPHHLLPGTKKRTKRSAQGQFRMRSLNDPDFHSPVDNFYLDQLQSPDLTQDELVAELLKHAFQDKNFNIERMFIGGSDSKAIQNLRKHFRGRGLQGLKNGFTGGGKGGGLFGSKGGGGKGGGIFGGKGGGGKGGGGLFGGSSKGIKNLRNKFNKNKGGSGGKGGGIFGGLKKGRGGLKGGNKGGRGGNKGGHGGQRPSYNPSLNSAHSHGTDVIGKTSTSFPICTDANIAQEPWTPCLLPGGELRGPGGLVIKPPETHPIVQIHVDDGGKLPDLAFYPINSPIDKIAQGANPATAPGNSGGYNAPQAPGGGYNAPKPTYAPSNNYNAPSAPAAPSYNAPALPSYNAPGSNYNAPSAPGTGYNAPSAPGTGYTAPTAPGYNAPSNNNLTPGYNAPAAPGYNAPVAPGYNAPNNNNLNPNSPNYIGQGTTYKTPTASGPSYNAPGNAPSYNAPAPNYNAPATNRPSYNAPAPNYNAPAANQPSYNAPATNYNAPGTNYNAPGTNYNAPSSNYNAPASNYNAPNTNSLPSYNLGAVTQATLTNYNVNNRLRKNAIPTAAALSTSHVSFPGDSPLPASVPSNPVPPPSFPFNQVAAAQQVTNQQEQFFRSQQNPLNTQRNPLHNPLASQGLHAIPAPQSLATPPQSNIITGTNVIPVGPPINHPVLNPNNPFLEKPLFAPQPAVPQQNLQALQHPVQPHTTTFVPPPSHQPQQPAANALPLGTFDQNFLPFTPAPWYFNGSENSGTLQPPTTESSVDNFKASPKQVGDVLNGVFTEATAPTNLVSFSELVTDNPLGGPQFEQLNLKHSSVPLEAMTRGEIVQHFKIRENALQRLLSGIDPGEFDAPKSGKIWKIQRRPDLPAREASKNDLQAIVLNSLSSSENLEALTGLGSDPDQPADLGVLITHLALNDMKIDDLPEEVTVKTTELRELFDHMENTSEKAPTLAPHLKEGADGPEVVTVRTTELQKLLENIDPSVFKRPSSPWSGVTLR